LVAILSDSVFQNLILLIDGQLNASPCSRKRRIFPIVSPACRSLSKARIFRFGSEWDTADLYLLEAFYHTLDALFQLLSSQSFEGLADLVESSTTTGTS
jgi:hypothetical protein